MGGLEIPISTKLAVFRTHTRQCMIYVYSLWAHGHSMLLKEEKCWSLSAG